MGELPLSGSGHLCPYICCQQALALYRVLLLSQPCTAALQWHCSEAQGMAMGYKH